MLYLIVDYKVDNVISSYSDYLYVLSIALLNTATYALIISSGLQQYGDYSKMMFDLLHNPVNNKVNGRVHR